MKALRGRFRQVALTLILLALTGFWVVVFFALGSIFAELRR